MLCFIETINQKPYNLVNTPKHVQASCGVHQTQFTH